MQAISPSPYISRHTKMGARSDRLTPGLIVVTVAYNSLRPLKDLGSDLSNQEEHPHTWIIVNNSPVSSPLNIQEFPGFTCILEGTQGAGFAKGCNQALEWIKENHWPHWAWLVNPDVRLLEGHEISRALEACSNNPRNAIIGTRIQDPTGIIESSAGWISNRLDFRSTSIQDVMIKPDLRCKTHKAVDWVSGCSMLIRPSAHKHNLYFDEQFPLYYEDIDLCLRQASIGSPVVWSDVAVVSHLPGTGSETPSQRRIKLSTISYLRFLQRHRPRWQLHLRSLRLLSMSLLRFPIQPRRSLAVLQGWWEATCNPIR